MATARELVNVVKSQEGDEYVFGVEVSPSDSDPNAFDCSELVEWACNRLKVKPKIPDGSWYQASHCKKHDTIIDVETAINTEGALLFFFSSSPFGRSRPRQAHVAISLGNGKTFEARSKKKGVGTFNALDRGWTHAGLIPGLKYADTSGEFFRRDGGLAEIAESTPIIDLSEEQVRELQRALSLLGYPIGEIDGTLGPKTRNAWAEFKTDILLGNPDLIGKDSVSLLLELVNDIAPPPRPLPPPTEGELSREETVDAIKRECEIQGIGLDTQIAYVLATVKWETGHTFKPVREAPSKNEEWRRANLRYYPYYGRGYVQLTLQVNYERYSRLLGIDMVGNPDLALEHQTSLFILVHGFKTGAFTGRKISQYINKHETDFIRARRCINGVDQAHRIAQFAEEFLRSM